MSFVGPRPEVPEYVDRSSALERGPPGPARPDRPVTLRFRDEESLMAGVEGIGTLLPGDPAAAQAQGYRDYLRRRTWRSDVGVLLETVLASCLPASERSCKRLGRAPRPADLKARGLR